MHELVREVPAPGRERHLADGGAHPLHVARLAHEQLGGVDPRRREHGAPVDAGESVEVAEAQAIGGRPGIALLLPRAMGAGEPRLQGHDRLGVSGVGDPGQPRDVGNVGIVPPTILRVPRGVLEIVDAVGKGDPRLPEGGDVAVRPIGIDLYVDFERGPDGERLEVPHAGEQRLPRVDGPDPGEFWSERLETDGLDPRGVHEAQVEIPDPLRIGAGESRGRPRRLRDRPHVRVGLVLEHPEGAVV